MRAITYDRAGHLLAANDADGTLHVSNLTRGKAWTATDHAETGPLAFSPDDRTVAVGSSDGRIRLRDLATGAVRTTLPVSVAEQPPLPTVPTAVCCPWRVRA